MSAIPRWLEDQENGLTERFRRLLHGLWGDLKTLDERIEELDRDFEQIARQDPVAIRLQQVRGIGPLTSTALLATVGDTSQFASGREMAAWFGFKPKQNSSGGKERLLGISKRGDAYLRSLRVHGARAVIRTAQAKTDRLSTWVIRIATTRHPNIATMALANKTARVAWTMLTKGTDYRPQAA
jgi:transposase